MLFHRKNLVILTYESKCLSYEITNAPRGCALARKEDVANATALGARVSQAKLFVLETRKMDTVLAQMDICRPQTKAGLQSKSRLC